MDADRQPATRGLAALTHDELMAIEQMLAEKFDAAYQHALDACAATGQVPAALAARLAQIQAQHAEVVQALQLDLLQDQANLGSGPEDTD
jgi:hypothetical protein